jgi:hypothetical protein
MSNMQSPMHYVYIESAKTLRIFCESIFFPLNFVDFMSWDLCVAFELLLITNGD